MDKLSDNAALLEALLFASGDPAPVERLAAAASLGAGETIDAIRELQTFYAESGSGVAVVRLGEKYQMVSRKEFSEQIRTLLDKKRNAPLSPAAMEVLAVIAYNQPVTKAFVEQVRGVDCSGVVNSLCVKGLIEEKGRLDLPGRPLVYGTTDAFLRAFTLADLSELPPVPVNPETNSLKAVNKDGSVLDGQVTMM